MKIKSRKQKIEEYNQKYPNRYYDPEISLRNYFLSRGWNFDKALKIIKEQLLDMKKGYFTEEDLINAKKYMISGLQSAQDEQDSEVTYYIGQELSGKLTTLLGITC